MHYNEQREKNDRKVAQVKKYFNLVMSFIYVVSGLMIVFVPFEMALSATTRGLLGLLLILYGVFRFVRSIGK